MSKDARLDEFVDSSVESEGSQWMKASLEEISNWIKAGGTPRTSNNDYWGGDIPWVQTGELTKRRITATKKQITQIGLENSTAKRFPSGTILIGMYGEPTVGESAILEVEATTNQACCGIFPDMDMVNATFLHQVMQYEKPRLYSLRAGSGQQNIRQGIIRKFETSVPPLEEQRKIASVLYTVDQAIQKTERVIDQIDHVRRGIVQNLLTEGARNHADFTDTKTGRQPAGWDYISFEDLLVDTRYGTDQKSNSDAAGYPTLRIPNVVGKRITLNDLKHTELDESELNRLRLEDGDILIVRTNGNPDYVGQCATFSEREDNFVFASYLIRLRVDEERVFPAFVQEFLNSSRGRAEMNGWIRSSAGNYNLSVGAIEKFRVPVPPLEEQAEIAEKIRAIDEAASTNRDYHHRLKQMKRGLMQDLLSGEVRTTDADIEIPGEVLTHG
jgi:type I restriction enzyme S subunit